MIKTITKIFHTKIFKASLYFSFSLLFWLFSPYIIVFNSLPFYSISARIIWILIFFSTCYVLVTFYRKNKEKFIFLSKVNVGNQLKKIKYLFDLYFVEHKNSNSFIKKLYEYSKVNNNELNRLFSYILIDCKNEITDFNKFCHDFFLDKSEKIKKSFDFFSMKLIVTERTAVFLIKEDDLIYCNLRCSTKIIKKFNHQMPIAYLFLATINLTIDHFYDLVRSKKIMLRKYLRKKTKINYDFTLMNCVAQEFKFPEVSFNEYNSLNHNYFQKIKHANNKKINYKIISYFIFFVLTFCLVSTFFITVIILN